MRKMLMIAILGATVALAACGGGKSSSPDRVLHLGSVDITESAFRQRAQSILSGSSSDTLCKNLQALSDEAAAAALQPPNVPTGAPTAVPDDVSRAATIVREECARLGKGN